MVLLLPLDNGVRLRLVSCYRHLGSVVTQHRSLGQDVAARAASGRAASAALSRKCLSKQALPEATRTIAAVACVHRRSLNLAGTCPSLLKDLLARLGA